MRAGLQQIVVNFAKTADSVSGPVAIVAVGAEVARADATGLFQFAAIVNINLAVVNLLPLPVRGWERARVQARDMRTASRVTCGAEPGCPGRARLPCKLPEAKPSRACAHRRWTAGT